MHIFIYLCVFAVRLFCITILIFSNAFFPHYIELKTKIS